MWARAHLEEFSRNPKGRGVSVSGEQVGWGLEKLVHGTELNQTPNQWETADSVNLYCQGINVLFTSWNSACILCLNKVVTGKYRSKPEITWHWWLSFIWISFPSHTFLESRKAFYRMRVPFSQPSSVSDLLRSTLAWLILKAIQSFPEVCKFNLTWCYRIPKKKEGGGGVWTGGCLLICYQFMFEQHLISTWGTVNNSYWHFKSGHISYSFFI